MVYSLVLNGLYFSRRISIEKLIHSFMFGCAIGKKKMFMFD